MTYTTTPTKPGSYWWRRPGYPPELHELKQQDGEIWCDSAFPTRVYEMVGEWCRLVPADETKLAKEIKLAYEEGCLSVHKSGCGHWSSSRASRVVEGMEP